MLSSSLNTGSTDLRDTDVQHPKTTETLSLLISSRAFSANSGQFEAGSTTTASSFLPRRPPFLFCSSINIRTTSFSVVSLIAMVPEREWRTPTLMVSSAWAGNAAAKPMASPAAAQSQWRWAGREATVWTVLNIPSFLYLTRDGPGSTPQYVRNSQRACQRNHRRQPQGGVTGFGISRAIYVKLLA